MVAQKGKAGSGSRNRCGSHPFRASSAARPRVAGCARGSRAGIHFFRLNSKGWLNFNPDLKGENEAGARINALVVIDHLRKIC